MRLLTRQCCLALRGSRLNPVVSPPLSHCKRSIKADGEGVSPPRLPLDTTDRSQNVWQWILESERQGKHKPHR